MNQSAVLIHLLFRFSTFNKPYNISNSACTEYLNNDLCKTKTQI